jgi:pimeloyl-ACP methyl ester carboxylesterase
MAKMKADRLDSFRGGAGEPLVLLNAIFQSWHSWSPLLDRLTAERDVLALTHLGHAGSPPFPTGQSPTIAAWTDAVEAELDAVGFDRPDIVGHSLGGWIALELAKRGRVRSIVALAPAGQDRVATIVRRDGSCHSCEEWCERRPAGSWCSPTPAPTPVASLRWRPSGWWWTSPPLRTRKASSALSGNRPARPSSSRKQNRFVARS